MENGIVVWGVARDGGDHSGTLPHGDAQHRPDIDLLVTGERSLEGLSDEVLTGDISHFLDLAVLLQEILVGHVPGCSVRADEDLVVLRLESSISPRRKHEAVGLSVHGLRSQSGSHKIDLSVLDGLQRLWELEELNLDESVLLGSNSLSLRPIVISAHLVVLNTEDRSPLPELDEVVLLQLEEVPSDEAVEVGVEIGGNKRPPPVSHQTELFEVLNSVRGEVADPVDRVSELRDLLLWDSEVGQDLVLEHLREILGLGCDQLVPLFYLLFNLLKSEVLELFLESLRGG